MSELIGQTLGQYRIIEKIGQGGMATVYKAFQPGLDRYVALKILPLTYAQRPGFRERFQREARAIANLNHPNILPVYDFGQEGEYNFIVMRYIEGAHTLKEKINPCLPRANIYGVLQKLEERGAVIRFDTPEGVRYTPLPAEKLIQRLSSLYQATLATAQQALNEINRPAEYEYVGNIRGYPGLLENAQALLDATQERLLLALWPQEAANLAEPLAQAEERGVEITTLCLAACPQECGGCRGQVYRYRVAPERARRWLVALPDGAEVLAGEVGPSQEALAVRTRQRLLIELATWYIHHSIAIATILSDLGGRLEQLLRPETLSILASLETNGQEKGWLEQMVRLVTQED